MRPCAMGYPVHPRVANVVARTGLTNLVAGKRGSLDHRIGLVDGPIDIHHPSLRYAHITQRNGCRNSVHAIVRSHASFVASMLVGTTTDVFGLCRDCTLVSIPVIDHDPQLVNASALLFRIATAITDAVDAGVTVVQLGIALDPDWSPHDQARRAVLDACCDAARRGVVIIAPAGNSPTLGGRVLLGASGVIPVGAATDDGRPLPSTPLGPQLGVSGLLAPGADLPGAVQPDGIGLRSGSSFAASFVTASYALLRWTTPCAAPATITAALVGFPSTRRRSIVPPQLNAGSSFSQLHPQIQAKGLI